MPSGDGGIGMLIIAGLLRKEATVQDPRMRGFNYSTGWVGAPKPPTYL